jgi:putative transposase
MIKYQGIPSCKNKWNEPWLDEQESRNLLPPPQQKIVSIDPGIRTFATLYDPSGIHIEWAPNDYNRIRNFCRHIDDLTSRINQKRPNDPTRFLLPSKKRYRMGKALTKMRFRVKNWVKENHNKLTKYLCENYNVILLPDFQTSKMVKRSKRRLNSKTFRSLQTWSHYDFKLRLHNKAEQHDWTQVIKVTEEYTSKTCGRCGNIHQKLGGNKTFECPNCGWKVDRDLNGARNILLKWILENSD